MIWKFFKEYRLWYLIYTVMTGLYFLNFYLYRLPLTYFLASFLMNLVILIGLSIWKYIRFRKKILILQDFVYVNEIDDLQSPSELAYQQVIYKLNEIKDRQGYDYKSQVKGFQALIKMWSHQMKVPLSALSLMSQTNALSKEEVDQQLIRLNNYLSALLNFIKFKEGQDDFRFEAVAVKPLVMDQIKHYRVLFLAKNIQVEVTGDWQLNTDRKWLSFAIAQILDNAIKYSKSGGRITISMTEEGMSIADRGIGILAEDLPRLFEEGFTGFNGHQHQKASGLGLYMTKEVLDQLGLTIDIESQIDAGTVVHIRR